MAPRLVLIVSLLAVPLASACARRNSEVLGADASTLLTLPEAPADVEGDATPRVAADGNASLPEPFGHAVTAVRTSCRGVSGDHVNETDLRTSFVAGEDLLALVNRSPQGQLAPDWAPPDLVDLRTGRHALPSECEKVQCLRGEAANALTTLLAAMKSHGFPGRVESAYRGYATQCGTFLRWASKGGFCEAAEQSAIPGHSQHQLGTTVDIFSEEWGKDPRGVFRAGFGCTPAGAFLQEHAVDFGFVLPYPLHPDDRHAVRPCLARWDIPVSINPNTGYRFEHWHFRYVGKENAARFAAALSASLRESRAELTLEQWIRSEKGLAKPFAPDAELPVCDGCNCGACSTLAAPGKNECDKTSGALHLDERGRAKFGAVAPRLMEVRSIRSAASKAWQGHLVEVTLSVPDGTLTQPPILGLGGAGYAPGTTFEKLAPYPKVPARAFPPLEGAWMVGVEPIPNVTGTAYPWRAGLSTKLVGQTYNRANVLLPTRAGNLTLELPLPSSVARVRVTLLQAGTPKSEPLIVDLP